MLGMILSKLADPSQAEAALAALNDETILAQIKARAEGENTTVGEFTSRAVSRVLNQASEEIWLDLLGKMAGTPEPGTAALAVILGHVLSSRSCNCNAT
ncbi:MAG: hypothetical protein B7Z75_13960 [Acidocella sp. 20-57-95]|nr:MAG: hypothetical protein B7Z75_13960 [Acidocella sp. 20-57-95]OYV58115.1 MAG: hypothetical protein B7Z71_11060 [Acidocella sp. 21-58-7]HQT64032.1 hypothetical protein [Acidocella sp.]